MLVEHLALPIYCGQRSTSLTVAYVGRVSYTSHHLAHICVEHSPFAYRHCPSMTVRTSSTQERAPQEKWHRRLSLAVPVTSTLCEGSCLPTTRARSLSKPSTAHKSRDAPGPVPPQAGRLLQARLAKDRGHDKLACGLPEVNQEVLWPTAWATLCQAESLTHRHEVVNL